MNFILKKINNPQQNKMCKILWTIVSLIYLVMLASFFILPFLGGIRATNIAFTVLWYISCALLIESIIEKPLREKNYKGLINIVYSSPIILFFTLVFVGKYFEIKQFTVLYSFYWALLSFFIVIVLSIVLKAGNETSKQMFNKTPYGNKLGIIAIMFVLAIVAFVLSIVFKSTVWQYIFGIILSLSLMFNACSNYQKWSGKKVALITKTATFIDFLLGLGIMIYLIYIIQDKELQNIILIITSAVIGGLLTLLGVAWTIKRQDEIRSEDNRLKVKPMIVLLSIFPLKIDELKQKYKGITSYHFFSQNREKIDLSKPIREQIVYTTSDEIFIKNLDNGVFKIKSVICDGDICKDIYDITIEKNEVFILQYDHKKDMDYETANVVLVIEDIYENIYHFKLIYNGNILLGFEEQKDNKKNA